MILADTSVWVDHFRSRDPKLASLLESVQILGHPFVVGEIALGHLRRRGEILSLLQSLPQAQVASHDEVLLAIERLALAGEGVGYVDAHLLASAHLTSGASFWTRDKRLAGVAERLRVAARI